jgi:hypothetical protein
MRGDFTSRLPVFACYGSWPPQETQIHEKINVGCQGFPRCCRAPGELCGIQQVSMFVCQHRPEPPQGRRRDPRAWLWSVLLKVAADESFAPAGTPHIARRSQDVRKSSARSCMVLGNNRAFVEYNSTIVRLNSHDSTYLPNRVGDRLIFPKPPPTGLRSSPPHRADRVKRHSARSPAAPPRAPSCSRGTARARDRSTTCIRDSPRP